jgi:tight adherence protein C
MAHSTLATLLAMLLLGLAAFRLAERHTTLRRLRAVIGNPVEETQPNGPVQTLQWIGQNIPGAGDETLRQTLAGAGWYNPAALPVFVAIRFISSAGVLLVLLLRPGARLDTSGLLLALFATFFVSRLFVIGLKLIAEARQREIRRELPPVVDVLLMVLGSGVSIDQCLRYVAGILERTAPRVGVVLKRYVADVDNGMSYETAFDRLGHRLGVDEGRDLANLIRQALLQGGEITASLERFGADISEKRVALAREQIGRKAILLTMVMLAFFMPVLLVTLAGPAVSHIQDTMHSVKQQLQKEAK